jgi:hypothetical protein
MTIKELIEKLKEFPEDMLVCVNDYENGRSWPEPRTYKLDWKDYDIDIPANTLFVEL